MALLQLVFDVNFDYDKIFLPKQMLLETSQTPSAHSSSISHSTIYNIKQMGRNKISGFSHFFNHLSCSWNHPQQPIVNYALAVVGISNSNRAKEREVASKLKIYSRAFTVHKSGAEPTKCALNLCRAIQNLLFEIPGPKRQKLESNKQKCLLGSRDVIKGDVASQENVYFLYGSRLQ